MRSKTKKSKNSRLSSNYESLGSRLNKAIKLHKKGMFSQAQSIYKSILKIEPNNADVLHLLGVVAGQRKKFNQSIELIDKAIEISPTNASYFANRGIALKELDRFDDALESLERAIAINPRHAEAYSNRGVILQKLGRLEDALRSCDRAIEIRSDYAEAYFNRGVCLQELWQLDAAAASYQRAVFFAPNFSNAHFNRGAALEQLGRFSAAVSCYEKVVEITPESVEGYARRGDVLRKLNRLEEAVASLERAFTIDPKHDFLLGMLLLAKLSLCDWRNFDADIERLRVEIQSGRKVTPPFVALAAVDSPALQKAVSEVWSKTQYPSNSALGPVAKNSRGHKIRVGFFSSDFRDHPVSHLTAELFEIFDRSKFQLFAFSFGHDKKAEMRQRILAAFDEFTDVEKMSDISIARLSREKKIDIAVDLGGFTTDSRPNIFAFRAAPLQVSYLGYPGTMSADYMDYLIADPVIVSEQNRGFFSENIVYLTCYMPRDGKQSLPKACPRREDFGLPETGFVFCSFVNGYKLNPRVFDSWMRILSQVPGSLLWLGGVRAEARCSLMGAATAFDVDTSRLVFADRLPSMADHLARLQLADLFLDTWPYNAHTTASDALWAGLPVLTCMGKSFACRVAGSLLTAMDLPELITQKPQDFERRAVDLATDPPRLASTRQRLQESRVTSSVFDSNRYAREMEDAFEKMMSVLTEEGEAGDIWVTKAVRKH